ncbi:DUF6624 domain-containing protein [Hymenobacter monticola]|uniref:Uncharacterized protein n=1 Tax=Hymenobacter monticola TaxID=1705399 RepID=A0ABY4B6U5_9BACT|nr:DUF6624 domain-containing protein [Hymenobacter monticola]UOE34842.1 hypothetical protein MTP16_04110 [Hymenobacter monticola]
MTTAKLICLLLVALVVSVSAKAQTAVLYPKLSKTLDSLRNVDQWPMQRITRQEPDSIGRNLEQVEKDNYARHQPVLEKIVRQFGFPGFREVGKTSSYNFWLLVQHADAHVDFQRKVLKLMRREVQPHNADPVNYAYLVDRLAINTGQLEEYGTQLKYTGNVGDDYSKVVAVPVSLRDSKNVDKRRAAIGMGPLQEYLNGMADMTRQMNKRKP